jgi:NAD(P)-dependent dehydrogenase (short-subunit alcohol dehydrogenase family)
MLFMKDYPKKFPPQHQDVNPGMQYEMDPQPVTVMNYKASDKLKNKVALITGGDSGIGRSVAVMFAMEGADIAISYLNEEKDAEETKKLVEETGRKCLLLPGDIRDEEHCKSLVKKTVDEFGKIDCLINNAAYQMSQTSLEDIPTKQLIKTFEVNVFAMFYITKAALAHMEKGSTIINCTSVTAYRGSPHLIDYSATKGAMLTFTRSLAASLAAEGIRVNAVAPGPVWTPLIPASFPAKGTENFGSDVPLGRAGQPEEIGPCFVFLASEDSSYMTGQVLHPNGGEAVES